MRRPNSLSARVVLVAALLLGLAAPAWAEQGVGVVIMHGKNGNPDKLITPLGAALIQAGCLVEMPEMPWSGRRAYDRSYEDAMLEIDAAVERLRQRGAQALVVAGHSLGANAALGYAATHPGLLGVAAIAPGHVPKQPGFRKSVADGVAKAQAMMAEGKGDTPGTFDDVNQGRYSSAHATARVYLSYFDPEGPAVMSSNAARLQGGAALLWVVGTGDPHVPAGPGLRL
jgi:pimeloyl-ACP methyl ester carboxylesterase